MEPNINNTVQTKENLYPFFVSIRFRGSDKSYFFSTSFSDLKPGDLVLKQFQAMKLEQYAQRPLLFPSIILPWN